MLREDLKKELDKLNDEQLRQIADFITSLKFQDRDAKSTIPLWQKMTAAERAKEFRQWTAQLPCTAVSLSNQAFSRELIYTDTNMVIPSLSCPIDQPAHSLRKDNDQQQNNNL